MHKGTLRTIVTDRIVDTDGFVTRCLHSGNVYDFITLSTPYEIRQNQPYFELDGEFITIYWNLKKIASNLYLLDAGPEGWNRVSMLFETFKDSYLYEEHANWEDYRIEIENE